MKTKFIGHSSILIESGKDKILCDPWYTGTAFNDGWKLLSEPKTDINDLDFNYIWYSHEHPDHFSVVDIKKIDKEKRKNITVLFQETIDNKVKDFCIKNDFKVKELEPFKAVKLSDSLEIINGTDGFDSWLCVKDSEKTILNLNDCRLDDVDELNKVKDKIGNIDALYTQFGYANWAGNPGDTKGPKIGRRIVESQLKNQIDVLKPRVVVPFASFVWFCHEENTFWNDLSIGIRESYDFLSNISDKVHVFYPGDEWMVGEDWNTDPQWWNEQVIRDWETIQERVKLQMQTAANRQMGADVEDIDSAYTVDRVGSLRLVSYEQFILESNAGQFREERFYCDKGRRWMAKVRELFASYGYNHVRKVEVEDMVLLEVSKNPMGEI